MKNAIILAGGKGERLRPLTESRPKCMVPVLGNPLLSFQLKWLRSHGIEKVVICCGYLSDVIEQHFGDGRQVGLQIEYLKENEPLGRGGALKSGMQALSPSEGPVVALNGDALTNLDLKAFQKFHFEKQGTVTLVSVPLISPYGIVDFSEDPATVSGFKEKPQLPFWINAGIYLLNHSVLELLPTKGDHEDTTFPLLASKGELKAFKTQCFWKPVDTVKDLSELRSQVEDLLLGAFFQPTPAAPVS